MERTVSDNLKSPKTPPSPPPGSTSNVTTKLTYDEKLGIYKLFAVTVITKTTPGPGDIQTVETPQPVLIRTNNKWEKDQKYVTTKKEQEEFDKLISAAIKKAAIQSKGILPADIRDNVPSEGIDESTQPEPGENPLNQLLSVIENIFKPLEIDEADFKSQNIKTVLKDKIYKYPLDILWDDKNNTQSSPQDVLEISMYEYKAPYSGLFKVDQSKEIFKSGVQRSSAFLLEDFIAKVILPMPNSVSDANSANWGEDTMNSQTAGVASMVKSNAAATGLALAPYAIQGAGSAASSLGVMSGISQALSNLPAASIASILATIQAQGGLTNPASQAAITSLILKMLQYDVPPETILSRGAGVVPNSNLELLFNGPTLRSFQFNYRLSPRSEDEAKSVRKIIRFFKQGMAPKKASVKYGTGGAGGSSFFLGTPNIFKLNYKTIDYKINPSVNRFKTCALTNFNVSYTPDGEWTTYEDGQPVSVIMTLNFKELEPIFESDYQTKVNDARSKDLDPIKDDEVGY
jgi:hypothetical protein